MSYRAGKKWGKKITTNPDSWPLLLGDGGATQRSGNNYLQRHGTNGVDMNVAALLGGGGRVFLLLLLMMWINYKAGQKARQTA